MIYAIGDIHGEIWKLRSLLEKIESRATPSDRLVFLGDYVDRGPDTCGVIELLLQVQERRPDTIFLRGNHEQEMLDCRAMFESGDALSDFSAAANWFAQGGAETLASYPHADGSRWYERVPEEHWRFLNATILEFRKEPYLFVHAGVVPFGERWPYNEDPRLWIREPFLSSRANLGAIIVFGHTPQRSGKPLATPNKIGIDTAAAYGGPLTAVRLDPTIPYDLIGLEFLQAR